MAEDLFREAPIGQLIRFLSGGRLFQYPEEKPDFKLPDAWVALMNDPDAILPDNSPGSTPSRSGSIAVSEKTGARGLDAISEETRRQQQQQSMADDDTINAVDPEAATHHHHSALEKVKSVPIMPRRTKDGAILVDWYYSDDAANPQNWTNGKRLGVSVLICLYTFVVYTTSAIYTSSQPGIQKDFGVGAIESSLGLSLYVLGYGVGPLVFSPLSEIPRIGRNPVYVATMVLFVILSIPTAFVQNYPGLMVLRFLTGFFGSPCLASGGASLADMYSLLALPYAMMAWVSAAYCGRESPYFCSPSLV
jgi:DHA1 family multidrug resistance protein-like MFS transporter